MHIIEMFSSCYWKCTFKFNCKRTDHSRKLKSATVYSFFFNKINKYFFLNQIKEINSHVFVKVKFNKLRAESLFKSKN
jgi:hypothetical protein